MKPARLELSYESSVEKNMPPKNTIPQKGKL
jgi:hypothetical protein